MFAFVAKVWRWLFGNPSVALFQPSERSIYGYFNGKQVVYVDPMELHRKLMAVANDIDIDIKVANSISKDAPKAFAAAARHVREVFSLEVFEKGGLTEAECMDLLAHFLGFCSAIKKKASLTATLPAAASPPTPASLPSTDAVPATLTTSDSTSTNGVPSTNAQAASPSEPALPSV